MIKKILAAISNSSVDESEKENLSQQSEEKKVFFEKPKVLLIDLNNAVFQILKENGFNVKDGTLGKRISVEKKDSFLPINISDVSLPNYTEQEIIVIDLDYDEARDEKVTDKNLGSKEAKGLWADCSQGVIDKRLYIVENIRPNFDRILNNGGVFIIFSSDYRSQKFAIGKVEKSLYGGLDIEYQFIVSNWNFLTKLNHLEIEGDFGSEIFLESDGDLISEILSRYISQANFDCIINYRWSENWVNFAKNKFGYPVSGAIKPSKENEGWIFIFPQIEDKASFLLELFKVFIPQIKPELFPFSNDKLNWLNDVEYQLPSVIRKRDEIESLRMKLMNEINRLEIEIEDEKNKFNFIFKLLHETGEELVEAVKEVLLIIGFSKVVDVDLERKEKSSLREDIRIHDFSPVLIIDIKGIYGKPSDSESMQSQKHAYIYMKEQGITDVKPLSIINHERVIPPTKRENFMPFRKEILDVSSQVELGLMTTFDLHKIVRSYIFNDWKFENVWPIFYRTGRIYPIPENYELIGKVKQVWKNAFSVSVENSSFSINDKIAIEFPCDFKEISVDSIQFNNDHVKTAQVGQEVGIPKDHVLNLLKKGFSVFLVR